jgi:hypothetical protein
MAIGTGLTIDEFERLPDNVVQNRELVNGELVDGSGKPHAITYCAITCWFG